MTISQIIACALAWTAAIVATWALVLMRRGRVVPYTPPPREYCGNLAPQIFEHGAVCEAYRVPATAEDSGLCAGCGMSDYKHRESS